MLASRRAAFIVEDGDAAIADPDAGGRPGTMPFAERTQIALGAKHERLAGWPADTSDRARAENAEGPRSCRPRGLCPNACEITRRTPGGPRATTGYSFLTVLLADRAGRTTGGSFALFTGVNK